MMVQGKCDLLALCLGIIGLIGTVAVTGLPMWKVTAFIGENIIVMETRWEGLWMTCFRQANIHMQCKAYDSLLFLPPDLQASRGLTCSALALSALGLLVSLFGLRCTSCLKDQPRVKSTFAIASGAMQILASVCVIIPVSWTAHAIIRDFYNPLLVDAQRRELGEALYIGWVTSAFLMASGVIFLCRRVGPKSGSSFYSHRQVNKPALNRFQPFNSIRHQALPQNNSLSILQPSAFSYAITPSSGQHSPCSVQPVTTGSLVYSQNITPPQNLDYHGPYVMQRNTLYPPQLSTRFNGSDPYASFTSGSTFHPVQQNPLYIGYNHSRVQSNSSDSSFGLRI
ncbi:claudin-8-like [Rhinichthys klamathensis goyatoka]|uniref:claudin-8-like n=1 Tax=Rhinichthys klamathensis goyatoka TaxID=3034132 RepID=UPI0024B600AC|nr:claudin-8-like [Rhinichthys klamathensis goyatoka]